MKNTTKGNWHATTQRSGDILIETLEADICTLEMFDDTDFDKEQIRNARLICIAGNLAQKFDPETWETHLTQFEDMKTALDKIRNVTINNFSSQEMFNLINMISSESLASLSETNEKP